MTLLQRAPREVYRVYGEQEFWALTEHELCADTQPQLYKQPSPVDARRRTLRRLAASTVLLSAVGACGGLVALTGVQAGTRRGGRAATRLSAAIGWPGSVTGVHARVWRQLPTGDSHPRGEQPPPAGRRTLTARAITSARSVAGARGVSPRRSHALAAPSAGGAVETAAVGAPVRPVAGTPEQTPPQTVAPAPTPEQAPARAAAASTPAGAQEQAEFGFER
ncbi:MAG TPA: hypothetical protein VMD79_10760 [Solirubrobacteraceae bacterium]|nr:hypothetical protein [Solirubrobacteraceae bacterium]